MSKPTPAATVHTLDTGKSQSGIARLVGRMGQRMDGFVNWLTGQGVLGRDRTVGSVFVRRPTLDVETLEAMFHQDDMAQRAVSAVPEDALRQGFNVVRKVEETPDTEEDKAKSATREGEEDPAELEADADPARPRARTDVGPPPKTVADLDVADAQAQAAEMDQELKALQLVDRAREVATWARLHGGAVILLGVEGAGRPESPLVDENVKGLKFLTVLDRWELQAQSWYSDPMAEKFGEPETYLIQPNTSGVLPFEPVVVHETRLVFFHGAMTSRRERQRNNGWHHSVLERSYAILQAANSSWSSVMHMLQDMSQAVFKIEGLIEAIAEDGGEDIQKRMALADTIRSVFRAVMVDAEMESFELVERSAMTGVADLVRMVWLRVAAAFRMPVTILMGQAPAGLNATGEVDLRWWYDTIQVSRRFEFEPRLLRIIRLVARVKFPDTDPESWGIEWPSLWQMTPAEEAAYRKLVAETDNVYVTMGAVLPEEVTLSRWGSGKYSAEMQVDLESRQAMMKANLETAEENAKNPPDPMADPNADPNAPPPKPGAKPPGPGGPPKPPAGGGNAPPA